MSRLLFVLDIGFDRGGPSVHLLQDVLRAGLKAGQDVDVILKDTGGGTAMPEEFIRDPHFRHWTIKEDEEKNHGFVGRYLNEVRYAKKCSRIFLKNDKYDAVFLQSNTTAFFYMRLLKKLKCRIVFNVQDIFPYNLKLSGQLPAAKITFPIFRLLQHLAYQKADRLITISDDMKQTLAEDGINPDKIDVVYNWSYADAPITMEAIAPENRYSFPGNPDDFKVVYAGNIGKMQNVELIAETAQSMQDVKNVHFYIIGDGANRNHIVQMTEGLKNVTLLPMQSARYAESIYAQADLNVIPLAPGGIRTALPSKTATVLRVNRPVVFCIDRDSRFASMMERYKSITVADVLQKSSLENVIRKIKKQPLEKRHESANVQPQLMSVRNADTYIEIITGEADVRTNG